MVHRPQAVDLGLLEGARWIHRAAARRLGNFKASVYTNHHKVGHSLEFVMAIRLFNELRDRLFIHTRAFWRICSFNGVRLGSIFRRRITSLDWGRIGHFRRRIGICS